MGILAEKNSALGDSLSTYADSASVWDKHRAQADLVENIYLGASVEWIKKYSSRIQLCSQVLEFGYVPDADGVVEFKFKGASFCRVRHCPVCQWRRQLKWKARFLKAAPSIGAEFPKARWLFLTLTVRNVPTEALRATVQHMAQSWQRLTQRKGWPAVGWVRALEVTRDKDGNCHPHYHCLLMVKPSYFGKGYINQMEWQELWKEAARLNYNPSVNIQTVKSKEGRTPFEVAMSETLKYSVKPEDMVEDADWLCDVTEQLFRTRGITVGGCLRHFVRAVEPEPDEDDPDPADNPGGYTFEYQKEKGYRRQKELSNRQNPRPD